MEEKFITQANLQGLCNELIKSDFDIFIPRQYGYQKLTKGENVVIDNSLKPTKSSFKELVFPKAEPIIYYKKNKSDVEIIDPQFNGRTKIILGAKPCDAKSIAIMSKVFNWDYKDEFFNIRADNTLIIGTLCNFNDEFCFCTSVGLSPKSTDGSDLFLIPVNEGYGVKIVSAKGKEFYQKYSSYFTAVDEKQVEEAEGEVKEPEVAFDPEQVRKWIEKNFEDRYWNTIGELCLGCAQCAFVCPVCHCFDIVDEDYCYTEGRRMKNWDACQFEIFTLHASGHNPRNEQSKRYRQRISHKFKYYPDKFNEILCTGCGRCSRGCPVSIDIKKIVSDINSFCQL
ncbi:MAG: 4Fe-4S dicluster domain-containing protein [Ignavibacteria bacterium]